MTSGPALPCPKCKRVLDPLSWRDAQFGQCRACGVDFEFIGFPALTAARARVVPKAVLVAEHATCFYHAENQAEAVCESCGRFLCSVCSVEFTGRLLCPGCIAAVKSTDVQAIDRRTLYDGIAFALAFFPLLFWPLTLVTAPTALGFVIFGWRKPRSLVHRGRAKFIVAGLFALAQITGWVFLLLSLWLRKK
jgi:hypothetical protein